jgi:alginate O-acetyltransferase complex protein AlgI
MVAGGSAIELPPIALPIGISFITFHALSYVIDIARGASRAQRNPLNLALYIALFPQLVAGPIVRYAHLAPQIATRETTPTSFAVGVRRFIIGLGKKVLIANTLAVPADAIFGLPSTELTFGLSWLGVICYTLQIYFDFSGYSDMAIGLGRMFGFLFLENFDYPYTASSLREFWRRWHISLSTWFRDYLYVPLGGNRRSLPRVYLNLVTVFALCGLWHGAKWGFLVWGLYHGCFLVLERVGLESILERWPAPIRHAYLLIVVAVGWVFFRAESLSMAAAFLAAMAGGAQGSGTQYHPSLYLDAAVILALIAGAIGAMPVLPVLRRRQERSVHVPLRWAADLTSAALLAGILLMSCMALAAGTYNPFIYYRF